MNVIYGIFYPLRSIFIKKLSGARHTARNLARLTYLNLVQANLAYNIYVLKPHNEIIENGNEELPRARTQKV